MQPQIAIPNVFPALDAGTLIAVVVFVVFVWWLVFTIVASYHLLRYARDSWITIPAIALHLFVSGWIFVFSTGGLH